jgi:hypothetical protein
MDLREIGWKGVDWMHVTQGRDKWLAFVNTVMNLQVPEKEGNFFTSRLTISPSRKTLLHGVSQS